MRTRLRSSRQSFRAGRSALVASAMAAAAMLEPATASAYCRSTTCVATAAVPCEADEDKCPVTGEKLWWPTSCISYALDERGTALLEFESTRDAVRKSFQAWSDVACAPGEIATMTFEEREPVSCRVSGYKKSGPNVNVVFFQDENWEARGIDDTIAKTNVTFDAETGEILDADIEFNSANNFPSVGDDARKVNPTDYDLQAVLTHEVGHFLGIAHSAQPDAVMYFAAGSGPGLLAKRKLTKDDVAALCEIYPARSGLTCNAEPRGGFDATCSGEPDTSGCSLVAERGDAGDGSRYPALPAIALAACWLRRRSRAQREHAAR